MVSYSWMYVANAAQVSRPTNKSVADTNTHPDRFEIVSSPGHALTVTLQTVNQSARKHKYHQRPQRVAAILGEEGWEWKQAGAPEQAGGDDEDGQEGGEGATAVEGAGGCIQACSRRFRQDVGNK